MMSRKLLVNIHLYLATFLAPIILMMAISGGLYLFEYKGNVEKEVIYSGPATFQLDSKDLEAEVTKFLQANNQNSDFEYLRKAGSGFVTRPTSRDYYSFKFNADQLQVVLEKPDAIKTIVELHKGHGPSWFKTFQKLTAFGLTFILLSGLWIALKTPPMRKLAISLTSAGLLVWLALAFI